MFYSPTRRFSFFKILCITSSLIGVQYSYSVGFAFVLVLLQKFGIPDQWNSFILLAGPLSGLVVQPLIGVYSDRCTSRFGRRRPYIAIGSFLAMFGLSCIGFCTDIAERISPSNPNPISAALVIVGLWSSSIALNVMQGPARAIVADIVPESQQGLANAMCSFSMGLANFGSNLIGSFDLSKSIHISENAFGINFVICLIVLFISTVPTLIAAKEEPLDPALTSTHDAPNPFVSIFKTARHMPNSMLRICAVFFLSWVAYTPFMLFYTAYCGKTVFGGSPDQGASADLHAKYDDGVRFAELGLAAQALLAMLYSPTVSWLSERIGVKWTYACSQVFAVVSYFMIAFFNDKNAPSFNAGFIILSALPGINFTTFNAIPYALIPQFVPADQAGVNMGVLNIFAVVSQALANFVANAGIYAHTGSYMGGFIFGGAAAVLGILLVPIIRTKSSSYATETSPLVGTDSGINSGNVYRVVRGYAD